MEYDCNEDVFVAKKENNFMFLTTSNSEFLDVKKYIWPYEWLYSYEKLTHVGWAGYKKFYSRLKSNTANYEYEQCLKMFKENYNITMGNWLLVYNAVDTVS